MSGRTRYLRCPENVLGWIPEYVGGNLSDSERETVDAHVEVCVDCREELWMLSGESYEVDVGIPDAARAFEKIAARIADLGASEPHTDPDRGSRRSSNRRMERRARRP